QANRTMLGRYQDELLQRRRDLLGRIQQVTDRAELNDLNDELIRTSARLDQLESTRQALERLGDQGFLLGIDCSGDGRAVIAVGNPDTARHTAVWVPGLGTDLGSTPGNVNRVLHLQEAADGHTPEASGDVSTIMWLGYDAPEATASVVTSERSKQGAIALDSFVNGLRVTHSDGNCHLTAVGHSYGSTVVAEAALSGERLGNARGLAVDDIITAGSPGMHTGSAADLNLDPHHVWAGSAADDPVANLANNPAAAPAALTGGGALFLLAWEAAHGTSPHSKSFGANEYAVDTSGHSDYWNERPDGAPTQSLDNQARIVVGDYDAVELRHGEAPEDGTGSGEDGTGSGRQR
ncbi:MAG: hypothetical protein JXA67_10630, partial [Micromonosporaceae bacterium]|nr:hypothetical protein [Micromonosporaceae bacterium]